MDSTAPPASPAARTVKAFVFLYCLDAALTAADELTAALGAGHALAPIRNPVGLATLAASALVYAWMAVSARPPKRILIPPILVLFWLALGAMPLAVTAPERLGPVAAAAQGAAALYLLLALGQATRGRPLALERALGPPGFWPWKSLGFVAANLVLGPLAFAALLLVTFTSYVERESRGFVTFDRSGVNLADRIYVRADRSIRLVGMMHIGERGHYHDLFRTFSTEGTVVLSEGVTDREARLESFGYGRMARSLGLDVQPAVDDVLDELDAEADEDGLEDAREWPKVEHADLDVGDFAPETVELLNRIGHLWSLSDRRAQLRELVALATDPRAEQWNRLFQADLLDKRNQHLLERIDGSLASYRTVVVPWGGLHLPGIERQVLAWGFLPDTATDRRLLSYRTVLRAALSPEPGEPESPPASPD